MLKKMQKNTKHYEIDEFWNDCLNNPYTAYIYKNSFSINNNKANKYNGKTCSIMSFKKYIKNKRKYPFRKYSSNLYSNLNETEYIKSKLISITQSSQYNLKNIQQALKKEELIPKRQEKINQKFIDLYNKDKKSKEILNKNNLIQRQKKDNLKLGECTFKPKKCKNKLLEKKINKLYINSNIYERNIKNQLRHNEKIALLFNEFSKINNNYRSCECFFNPNINIVRLNKTPFKLIYTYVFLMIFFYFICTIFFD